MRSSMKRWVLHGAVLLAVAGLSGCGVVEEEGAAADMGSAESALNPGCCTALTGTTQAFCDSIPQTPGRCNGVNQGTSCIWTCTGCCQALPGTTQAFCDSLPQTEGRCNGAYGGTACSWTC
ncbi:hypothetical protein [Corallococcus macrosporus]|uniref:Lipoprotein n=1 Tax=Corallococcus macrosporus DSM 14697 TaxID=1189310 RepID=A0A250JUB2_9BACT|nr:hypothetical protein [Corallococcus macrosporus]ATB47469.1 hypothetical protein MYMAC_003083 [Corallococcus macrosporus DSM 14697]